MDDRFGTQAQHEYATRLSKELKLGGLRETAARVLKTKFADDVALNLSTAQASQVITELTRLYDEKFPGRRIQTRKDRKSGQDAASSTPTSNVVADAHQIREWAQGAETVDRSALDADTLWVLERLARYEAVLQATRATDILGLRRKETAQAVNGTDPIQVAQLREFFGSEEEAAKAMGVTATTLKAWGIYVPPQRAWQAEVLTGGYVRAPRQQKEG